MASESPHPRDVVETYWRLMATNDFRAVATVLADESEAVTDVSVTDGVQKARALSVFTVRDDRIVRLVEYWPEPYPAPANRTHLVEPLG